MQVKFQNRVFLFEEPRGFDERFDRRASDADRDLSFFRVAEAAVRSVFVDLFADLFERIVKDEFRPSAGDGFFCGRCGRFVQIKCVSAKSASVTPAIAERTMGFSKNKFPARISKDASIVISFPFCELFYYGIVNTRQE